MLIKPPAAGNPTENSTLCGANSYRQKHATRCPHPVHERHMLVYCKVFICRDRSPSAAYCNEYPKRQIGCQAGQRERQLFPFTVLPLSIRSAGARYRTAGRYPASLFERAKSTFAVGTVECHMADFGHRVTFE